ncbi:MAG: pitrilysin family protein [Thermoanaerobaculia bacterium]|nr:pitrilysin family protein [Thermoanaerobaculia bacterium]
MSEPSLRSRPELPIQRHRLDNGLRVVLHRDPALPLVAVNLWYHTGSKNERPGKTGFAHLFEHMLFQGSANVAENEHLRRVQSVGGVANGSTWFDRTNYYETLPVHCLELGLWLESDRMGLLLPAMTEQKLETQRQVVMNERRQRVDNQPYGLASERLSELLYPEGHPYRWPVIGYMDDIAAATLDDVESFFRTYYTPSNATLTLAGDLEPDAAIELVERYFGDIDAGGPAPAPLDTTARLDGDRMEQLEDDVGLARIYQAYRIPGFGEPEWYAADLLATLLTTGKASRLHRDLVHEAELAQSVSCYALPTESGSSFHVVATARPGVEPDTLEAAVDRHLADIAEGGLDEPDLERARNRTLTSYFAELQTLDRRADLLSMFTTFFDRPEGVATEVDRYRDLSCDVLSAFAAAHLRPDDRARVHVVPRSKPAEGAAV